MRASSCTRATNGSDRSLPAANTQPDTDEGWAGMQAGLAFHCDEGNHVYTPDWNDGRGLIWGFVNKAGNARCEAHTVNTDGSEYQFTGTQSHPYWFGWEIMTTQAPSIVFQWKSNGNDDQHNQNYPLLLQVNAGYLHVWYIAPGEVWNKIGQAPLAAGTWHRLQLGILARPDTTGSIQVHLDGTQVANAPNARTWDVLGNKPRWGVYDSKLATTEQIHWANDLKLGTTRADAD
ncbi:heparin lyase I family protein [Streptomyces formicae]|uniref:Heparin lyase I family protein n=2 Tax=Streptomyces formicae TaxID=1616117 RepID=A0ABY3WNX6_9ACTN|nr:heparin lyase I family protein [Streptomyces formicae]UNM13012.1 heparin lyase I family protein [Streptomyces formicae]